MEKFERVLERVRDRVLSQSEAAEILGTSERTFRRWPDRIEARAEELIAEELTLRDLRKARDLTQQRMAEMLEIGQDSVSRLEQRSDVLLSTLRSYVSAMGGSLELVARFPDRPAVTLSGLTGLSGEDKKPRRKSRALKQARA